MSVPFETRGQSIAPFGANGFFVPDCYAPRGWEFIANTLFSSSSVPLGSGIGMSDSCSDGNGGVWALGYAGDMYHIDASSNITSGAVLPAGVYVATAASGLSAYAMSDIGHVYDNYGNSIGNFGAVGAPPIGLQSALIPTLATLLPYEQKIGFLNTSTASHSFLDLALAVQNPTCFAQNGNAYLVGGWASMKLGTQALVRLALNPADNVLLFGMNANNAFIFQQSGDINNWNLATSLSSGVAANPYGCAWTPDGTQVIVTDQTDSSVFVIAYEAGVLAMRQNFALTNASGVDVLADSDHALVCQPSVDQVTPLLYFGGSWGLQTALGIPGATDVVMTSNDTAAVAYASGVALLGISGDTWSQIGSVNTGFAATRIKIDEFGNIYASGSGAFAVIKGSTIIGSGSYTGTAKDILPYQAQLVLAVPAEGVYIFGNATGGSSWTEQSYIPLGGANLSYMVNETVFIDYSGSAPTMYRWTAPYEIDQIHNGVSSCYNGAGWNTVYLGPDQTPSSIVVQPFVSPNNGYYMATQENSLFNISASGFVLSQALIPQYVDRDPATPMGVSCLGYAAGNHLFASCSMSPVAIEIQ